MVWASRMWRRVLFRARSRCSGSLLPSLLPDMFSERGLRVPTTTESTRMPVSRWESSQPFSGTGWSESPSSRRRNPIATAAKA